jgi:hypothetical protein
MSDDEGDDWDTLTDEQLDASLDVEALRAAALAEAAAIAAEMAKEESEVATSSKAKPVLVKRGKAKLVCARLPSSTLLRLYQLSAGCSRSRVLNVIACI